MVKQERERACHFSAVGYISASAFARLILSTILPLSEEQQSHTVFKNNLKIASNYGGSSLKGQVRGNSSTVMNIYGKIGNIKGESKC